MGYIEPNAPHIDDREVHKKHFRQIRGKSSVYNTCKHAKKCSKHNGNYSSGDAAQLRLAYKLKQGGGNGKHRPINIISGYPIAKAVYQPFSCGKNNRRPNRYGGREYKGGYNNYHSYNFDIRYYPQGDLPCK